MTTDNKFRINENKPAITSNQFAESRVVNDLFETISKNSKNTNL